MAPPKKMNGFERSENGDVELLTPEEMIQFRNEIVQQMRDSVHKIFNTRGTKIGVSILMWDVGLPNGKLNYTSNRPRAEALQVWTKLRERSESKDPTTDQASDGGAIQ